MRDARPEARVAYLSERADLYGGGERSLCELAGAWRGSRVRPLVVLPRAGPVSDALDRCGAEWVSMPIPSLREGAGIGALTTIARLRRLVRERGIDLLHSGSPRTAVYAGLAARLTGRRHVFHLRASRASAGAADRFLLALSDRVIAVSCAAAARSRALRLSHKTRVVLTGLAPIHFLPRDEARRILGLTQDAFVLGVVGRVEEDKGRDDALSALAFVRRASPGALLVFLGAFDPEDAWTRTFPRGAATGGVEGTVRLAGPRPDAARLLKAFDVLLHPSRHEALPRVVIEALFAEVPIVAAAVGGLPEIIEPGRTGCLVPPRDPVALGGAAARVALDPVATARMTRAGLERARQRFVIERMVTDILEIYDELLPHPCTMFPGPSRPGTGEAMP